MGLKYLSTIFVLSTSLTPLHAADIDNGKVLHDENCVRCHQPEIYTRDDRKIKSLEQLRKQVQQCEIADELAWFEEEVDDVTEYLNLTYYLFGLK